MKSIQMSYELDALTDIASTLLTLLNTLNGEMASVDYYRLSVNLDAKTYYVFSPTINEYAQQKFTLILTERTYLGMSGTMSNLQTYMGSLIVNSTYPNTESITMSATLEGKE